MNDTIIIRRKPGPGPELWYETVLLRYWPGESIKVYSWGDRDMAVHVMGELFVTYNLHQDSFD